MDQSQREIISGKLIGTFQHAYFFVDQDWWNQLSTDDQSKDLVFFQSLGREFDDKIYPRLTSTYGFEWKPGIDGDLRITVLFHPLQKGKWWLLSFG